MSVTSQLDTLQPETPRYGLTPRISRVSKPSVRHTSDTGLIGWLNRYLSRESGGSGGDDANGGVRNCLVVTPEVVMPDDVFENGHVVYQPRLDYGCNGDMHVGMEPLVAKSKNKTGC